jgi:Ran GTPase-activating protein (RanGAP) involved in mRNA processing and transport
MPRFTIRSTSELILLAVVFIASSAGRFDLVYGEQATLDIDQPTIQPASRIDLPGRPQLTKFNLRAQDFTDQRFLDWLATQEPGHGLIGLNLEQNQLTEVALRALAESGLGAFHTLLLADNPVGNKGMTALASAPAFHGLTILYLADTGITATGLADLFGSDSILGFLIDVDLTGNRIGDEGARVLAQSPHTGHLTHLYLDNTGMTDVGARALADSPHLGALEYLSLGDNELTEAGVAYLLEQARFAETADVYFGDDFE